MTALIVAAVAASSVVVGTFLYALHERRTRR
jgi:nitrogen fixation-related uncharacterized protein